MTVNWNLSGERVVSFEECGYNFNKPENALFSITLRANKHCTPIEMRISGADKIVEAQYYIR